MKFTARQGELLPEGSMT